MKWDSETLRNLGLVLFIAASSCCSTNTTRHVLPKLVCPLLSHPAVVSTAQRAVKASSGIAQTQNCLASLRDAVLITRWASEFTVLYLPTSVGLPMMETGTDISSVHTEDSSQSWADEESWVNFSSCSKQGLRQLWLCLRSGWTVWQGRSLLLSPVSVSYRPCVVHSRPWLLSGIQVESQVLGMRRFGFFSAWETSERLLQRSCDHLCFSHWYKKKCELNCKVRYKTWDLFWNIFFLQRV